MLVVYAHTITCASIKRGALSFFSFFFIFSFKISLLQKAMIHKAFGVLARQPLIRYSFQ